MKLYCVMCENPYTNCNILFASCDEEKAKERLDYFKNNKCDEYEKCYLKVFEEVQ